MRDSEKDSGAGIVGVTGSGPAPRLTGAERIDSLTERYPFVMSFFADEEVDFADDLEWTLRESIQRHLAQNPQLGPGWERAFLDRLEAFIAQMMDFISEDASETISSVTVLAGHDKDGNPEPLPSFTLRPGDVLCLVGPTGSGKSRLLADIEWVASGDTPTGRRILLDGKAPDRSWRYDPQRKLVAQLSQNMHFVMDLGVGEFLGLHAQSRAGQQRSEYGELVERIWEAANQLAGEPFALDTPITSLSGGQSRALMIADTALLSRSPIVLIDEIENAGIDRRKALDLLIGGEKMVLMATHDPLLALYGDRRIVLGNGAMRAVITPSAAELANIRELRSMDARMMALRDRLRRGELLEEI